MWMLLQLTYWWLVPPSMVLTLVRKLAHQLMPSPAPLSEMHLFSDVNKEKEREGLTSHIRHLELGELRLPYGWWPSRIISSSSRREAVIYVSDVPLRWPAFKELLDTHRDTHADRYVLVLPPLGACRDWTPTSHVADCGAAVRQLLDFVRVEGRRTLEALAEFPAVLLAGLDVSKTAGSKDVLLASTLCIEDATADVATLGLELARSLWRFYAYYCCICVASLFGQGVLHMDLHRLTIRIHGLRLRLTMSLKQQWQSGWVAAQTSSLDMKDSLASMLRFVALRCLLAMQVRLQRGILFWSRLGLPSLAGLLLPLLPQASDLMPFSTL